jgi:hypothetical protein
MLKAEVIEPATSDWASPIVLVANVESGCVTLQSLVLLISVMCKDLWKLLHDINTSV